MQLNIFNNELVFRQVVSPARFVELLQRGKDLEYRQHGNTFYISLEHFYTARDVLREKDEPLMLAANYTSFANRFVIAKHTVRIMWSPASCEVSGVGMPWHRIIPATRYFDKAALNSQNYKRGLWDGHRHLFDAVRGQFPSGLLERIITILREENVPFEVERTFAYPKPSLSLHPAFDFTPTDDQHKSVSALDAANNGIAKLPTGFGKTSFVAAALIAKKSVRSMFLANQRILIRDAKRDFENVFRQDTHIKIGIIGDGEFDPGDITVASIQGVVAALSPPSESDVKQALLDHAHAERAAGASGATDKEAKLFERAQKKIRTMQEHQDRAIDLRKFLETVELFIVDESQVLGTNMWNKFLYACPAPYRYTLSATDTRGDGGRILIVAATGERRYESSAADQIEKKRLAEFRGNFMRFDHGIPKDLAKKMRLDFHQAYDFFIVNNELRNDHLCDQVIRYTKEGSVLALVTRITHGEVVRDMLIAKGMAETDVEMVSGDTAKGKREDAIERFRAGGFPVLIGTSIFDVGFNAKNASRMVRFNAGGSEVREPQRAGRTVRMREDESHGETYDIIDINVPYFEAQGWKRRKLLQEEFGKQRVKMLPGVITGHTDLVALRDIVSAIPDKTDRERGEQIIIALTGQQEMPIECEIGELEKDPNLKSLLEQLGTVDF